MMEKRGNRYRMCVYMDKETLDHLKWLQKAKAILQGEEKNMTMTQVISLLINEEYGRFWDRVKKQ